MAEWRQRMGTEEAKTIYKERAATAECVNALSSPRVVAVAGARRGEGSSDRVVACLGPQRVASGEPASGGEGARGGGGRGLRRGPHGPHTAYGGGQLAPYDGPWRSVGPGTEVPGRAGGIPKAPCGSRGRRPPRAIARILSHALKAAGDLGGVVRRRPGTGGGEEVVRPRQRARVGGAGEGQHPRRPTRAPSPAKRVSSTPFMFSDGPGRPPASPRTFRFTTHAAGADTENDATTGRYPP